MRVTYNIASNAWLPLQLVQLTVKKGSFNNHVDDVNENARHIIRYISLTSTVTRIMPCDVLWRALKHVHNNDNFFSSLLNFNTALKNSTSRKFAYKRN